MLPTLNFIKCIRGLVLHGAPAKYLKLLKLPGLIAFSATLVMAALPQTKLENEVLKTLNFESYSVLAHARIIPGIALFREPLRTDYKVLKSCITIKAYSDNHVENVYHGTKYCENEKIIWKLDYFDLVIQRLFRSIPIVKTDPDTVRKLFLDARLGAKNDFRSIMYFFCTRDKNLNLLPQAYLATVVGIENTFMSKDLKKFSKPTYLAKWDCTSNKWAWGLFYTYNHIGDESVWRKFLANEQI